MKYSEIYNCIDSATDYKLSHDIVACITRVLFENYTITKKENY